jgi:hypothetical protein
MAKILRKTAIIFGNALLAGPGGIGVLGSLAGGLPAYTIDPAAIMATGAWGNGWGSFVVADFPAEEDLNAIDFVHSYQIAYLLEMGIAEWDSATTYYTNSVVQSGGILYQSLIDNNTGNAPASTPSDWRVFAGGSVFYGGVVGAESSPTQLNLTITGFPASNVPVGTVVTCFLGVAFNSGNGFLTGGCVISINGGATQVISDYAAQAINASVNVYLAKEFSFFWNGAAWLLLDNRQNDGILGVSTSGTQNNYSPTGFAPNVTTLKIGNSGAVTITGLTNGLAKPNGWEVLVVNVGSGNITLSNLSGSSSTGNRFAVYNAADMVLTPGQFCKIRYSFADQEWLVHP